MRRSPIRSRTLALVGLALVGGLGATLPLASSANAASTDSGPAYKYWGYYHADGDDWKYSLVGASEFEPDDGTVEGWRYGLDTDGSRMPRVRPDYASVCGDQTTSADHKLVAVVIDYGIPEEAEGDDETPEARGACADVAADATGLEVLQSVAETTTGDAGISSVDGYPSVPTAKTFDSADIPKREPTVELATTSDADQQASDAADDSDDGAPWALIGVGLVVVVIAGGAVVVARRRS